MNDEVKKFLIEYCDFVTKVTSEPSLRNDELFERMKIIEEESNIKTARLLTAALGLGSEGGEFVEIVKSYGLKYELIEYEGSHKIVEEELKKIANSL